MTKKVLNQKTKYEQELLNTFESKFNFEKKPINRFDNSQISEPKNILKKAEKLSELKKKNKFN